MGVNLRLMTARETGELARQEKDGETDAVGRRT